MLDTSRYIHLNPVKAKMVLSYFKKGKEKQLYKRFVERATKDKCKKEEDEIDGISS